MCNGGRERPSFRRASFIRGSPLGGSCSLAFSTRRALSPLPTVAGPRWPPAFPVPGRIEAPCKVPELPDDDVVERRVLAGGVGHHPLEFFTAIQFVVVPDGWVQCPAFTELFGLQHLRVGLRAIRGIPGIDFHVNRLPVDGCLLHRLSLALALSDMAEGRSRRRPRRILLVNRNRALIPFSDVDGRFSRIFCHQKGALWAALRPPVFRPDGPGPKNKDPACAGSRALFVS